MPRCEGLPNGPCPKKKNDNTVRLGEGELMLCASCDGVRHQAFLASKNSQNSPQLLQPNDSDGVSSVNNCQMGDAASSDSVVSPAPGVTGIPPESTCKTEVSEVLYFIRNKFNNYPLSMIKDTIIEWYREDELLAAKSSLLSAVKAVVSSGNDLSVHQYAKTRIGNNKVKATVEDILHIWGLLDENALLDQIPVYCSACSARVPTITEELSDLAFLKKTVSQLSSQLQDLSKQMSALTTAVTLSVQNTISDGLQGLNNDICSLTSVVNSVVCDAARTGRDNISTSFTREASVSAAAFTQSDDDTAIQLDDMNIFPPLKSAENMAISTVLPSDYSGTTSLSATSMSQLVKNHNSGVGLGQNEDNPMQFKTVIKKSRKKIICGERVNSTAFRGVVKKAVFCVNRLEPDTSPDIISQFLKSQGLRVFSCFLTKPRTESAESESDSSIKVKKQHFIGMRVCVAYEDGKKIMSPDLWPAGVTVRPWSFNSRTSDQQSAAGSQ